jgi:anti-sigma B factor antagonist
MNSQLPSQSSDAEERAYTLNVPGDLISTTAEALRRQLAGVLEPSAAPRTWNLFTLDLSAAKMVDSVGLNLVVTILKNVRKAGARMKILYSSPNVQRTFLFTRLDRHLELVKV